MDKYRYLEVVKYEDETVVKRIDITGKGLRSVERISRGIIINLNHEEYFTTENNSESPLEII